MTPERFAATRPSPTCAGHGDFLAATAYQHPFAVAASALLPCFLIHHEVGKHLYGIAAPGNPYQRWIDTYRDEAFGETARQILALVDAASEASAEPDQALMGEVHPKAARHGWMFWDSAYRLEPWPV